MKKSILLALMATTIVLADQQENIQWCKNLKMTRPIVEKTGIDLFSIIDGKDTACEDHDQEEWQGLINSDSAHVLQGVYAALPMLYPAVISEAKQRGATSADALQSIVKDQTVKMGFAKPVPNISVY